LTKDCRAKCQPAQDNSTKNNSTNASSRFTSATDVNTSLSSTLPSHIDVVESDEVKTCYSADHSGATTEPSVDWIVSGISISDVISAQPCSSTWKIHFYAKGSHNPLLCGYLAAGVNSHMKVTQQISM
jgi:hypothetical protein